MSTIAQPKAATEISSYPLKYGGVGSRDTPDEILTVMKQLGAKLCDAGYLGMSGEADGADIAFHDGARQSKYYREIGFAAYLPYNGMRVSRTPDLIYEDHSRGIYDASKFMQWERAKQFAYEARGSFEGLGRGGIALHTRNAFQVLSPSLESPVNRLLCWAKPVGDGSKVRGGTNTAVQIARRFHIPVVNLYYEEQLQKALNYIAR